MVARPRGKRRAWQKAAAAAGGGTARPTAGPAGSASAPRPGHAAAAPAAPPPPRAAAAVRSEHRPAAPQPRHEPLEPLPPAMTLSQLPPPMGAAWAALGFAQPTEVQSRCWPACLARRDLLCVAPTGSGKTLGYALPLLELLRPRGHTAALVLVPTRELAQQVAQVIERIAAACRAPRPPRLRVAALFGGVDRRAQREQLGASPPPDVVVGTPGRLLDLAGLGKAEGAEGSGGSEAGGAALLLQQVCYLVLDEADKMLSMGLAEQVARLCAATHADRQTLLFTATFDRGLEPFAASLQSSPLRLSVSKKMHAPRELEGAECEEGGDEEVCAHEGELPEVPSTVQQEVYLCAEHKKPRRLLKLMGTLVGSDAQADATRGKEGTPRERSVLIFANKIKTVSFVKDLLVRHHIGAECLSSRLTQDERQAVLQRFHSGELPVLVATDVAARGLHIDGLKYVVNWDFGTNLHQYVHRVGRTGRQGQAGRAFSFFSRNLKPLAPAVVALLRAHGQPVDRYLSLLAEEQQGTAAGASCAAGRGDAVAEPPAGASAAEAVSGGGAAVDDDDDDDCLAHSGQRWLAARLVSPITGQAALPEDA
ncbi:hypothetical protein AB1Y20_022108 [Prymnesium parvum]|uniref:ATP-dependent RNA helicase n=1 Tax=Prymnesium parvum TaxID=97485 RepID=A0AB34JHD6_PRYPA